MSIVFFKMYSQASRNIFNTSALLFYQKNLINKDFIFSSIFVNVQKVVPCVSYHLSAYLSNENFEFISKDPEERKNVIDSKAQQEIDELLKNPEYVRKKKIIDMEILMLRHNDNEVPVNLRPRDWLEILQINSSHKRKKLFRFLFINEKHKEKMQELKAEKQVVLGEARKNRIANTNKDEFVYGISQNSLFRRITSTTMNKLWNWNNLKSCMFGNQIVIDCGFDKYMNVQEARSCARQIMQTYSDNRQHDYPFYITLCNADRSSKVIEFLYRYIPSLYDDDFPMNVTLKSYLEIFEKRKLVYLTSDSPTELNKYDTNSIYVIGAYVDKGSKNPVSLAIAKQQKLRMAKLPLDRYIRFGDGSSKILTVNQVCSILLDAQMSNWDKAFKHVPKRKLYESRVAAMESKLRRDLLQHSMKSNESYKETKQQKLEKPIMNIHKNKS